MQKFLAAAGLVLMGTALFTSTAMADDWTAVRLRGGVFALENGAWVQLMRGSVVPDDRVIKSAPGGRITLVRGAETIELGPDTTAQIADKSGFTTVYNHQGTVGIDAEARNVQHFAVHTPFLAAVVKGTAFTVQTSDRASTVTVTRGMVQVDDEQGGDRVNVSAGQQVSASPDAPITVASVVVAPPDAPKPPKVVAEQLMPTVVETIGGSGDSNPGADVPSVPAPDLPGTGPGIPDPSLPGPNVPNPSVPGPSVPGPSVPGPSLPGSGHGGPGNPGSGHGGPGNPGSGGGIGIVIPGVGGIVLPSPGSGGSIGIQLPGLGGTHPGSGHHGHDDDDDDDDD